MKKEPMPLIKKAKLIYSGELLIFAAIFLAVGFLKVFGVIPNGDTKLLIYNIITILGGIWFIIDLIWSLASPKRRLKVSLVDKFIMIPMSLYILVFDIICIVQRISGIAYNDDFIRITIACIFFYVTLVYIFQAIYHYYKPVPMMQKYFEQLNEDDDEDLDDNEVEEKED